MICGRCIYCYEPQQPAIGVITPYGCILACNCVCLGSEWTIGLSVDKKEDVLLHLCWRLLKRSSPVFFYTGSSSMNLTEQ